MGRNAAIVGISGLILVAMVIVAVTVGVPYHLNTIHRQDKDSAQLKTSTKAIKEICQPTDYKENCIKSLSSVAGNRTSDPNELIKLAFKVAIDRVKKASKESELLNKATKDPRTSKALQNCKELMSYAIEDLSSSLKRFENFDLSEINELVDDLKIWLSASMTYQETCLDGFEGAEGGTAKKMKKALQGASELTRNALAIINGISSFLSSLELPNARPRRLLSETSMDMDMDMDMDMESFPSWVSYGRRRLLASPITLTMKPNVVVAKDGTGKFTTINAALATFPIKSNETFVIHIKEGVYQEEVIIERNMQNVMMIGDGPTKTKITGNKNFVDGTPTFKTATVAVMGDGFIAKNIGFENSAGPEKEQAVALRVQADRSIFYNCQMDGYQDTLFAQTARQFYRDCTITGTIDFIFGNAAAIFQNCKMLVRKPMKGQQNIVTAQGRMDRREPTAIIIQNCTISADPEYYPLRNTIPTYLGRPWKERSRTFIYKSKIDDLIHPDGWLPWDGEFALNTCFYSELNNRGEGSSIAHRVKWKGIKSITIKSAQKFSVENFIKGNSWIKASGVPFTAGLLPASHKQQN